MREYVVTQFVGVIGVVVVGHDPFVNGKKVKLGICFFVLYAEKEAEFVLE